MLPESIPTVRVTAHYLALDGSPLAGQVVFQPPSLLTHSAADLFVGGPTAVPLDAEGRLEVELPATDADGWNPAGWTYTVTERLAGTARPRTYQIALAAAVPQIDLADIAPADPGTPQYVSVPGPAGPAGEPGPQGPPGPVRSVNGRSETDVVLTAGDLGAVATTDVSAPGGVAALGPDGLVPASQLPAGTGGGVSSVNGQSGKVVLTAADLGALTPAAGDARYLPVDGVPVTSVNGRTGAVALTAADVQAVDAGTAVLLTGDQTVAGAKSFATPPSAAADPTGADQLARRSYVDRVAGVGSWSPGDLGFLSWAFDPAASSASAVQYCLNGTVYLSGVVLTSDAKISNVVFYVPGYVGGTLTANSYAGLYTGSGALVGTTASLTSLKATEGTTAVLPLTTAYNAKAGRYWVALLVNGPSVKTNGPAFMVGASMGDNPGGAARMPGNFVRHCRLATTGLTALPGNFTPSTVVADANAVWAAVS
ncbi:phage tail protein [Streptomyces sp. NPDC059740]|uniref:phage tail protein n=1 Tax=Streptomyces sp. NPDC059740 TaxID=3346926 RepID=UPI00365553C0